MARFLFFILVFLLSGAALITAADVRSDAEILKEELGRSFWARNFGRGINKDRVYRVLQKNDPQYRKNLKIEYANITGGRHLKSDLNYLGKNNGGDVIKAQLLLDNGQLTGVDELFLSMREAGTDEKQLFKTLAGLDKTAEKRIGYQEEWLAKYGPQGDYYSGESSIIKALEGELSGTQQQAALKIYRSTLLSQEELNETGALIGQSPADLQKKLFEDQVGKISAATQTPSEEIRKELIRLDQERAREKKLKEYRKSVNKREAILKAECGPEGFGYRLCVPLPGQRQQVADFGDYVKLLYQFALGIAGAIVFMRIVYGGIQYTMAAQNSGLRQDAMDIIRQAIYGLILLFLATTILYIINPRLLIISPYLQNRPGAEAPYDF